MEATPEPSRAAGYTVRRSRPDDAAAFARMMSDEAVYAGVLQLPYPSAEVWRTRLAENDVPGKTDVSLVVEANGEVIGSAGLFTYGPVRRRHAMGLGIHVAAAWQGRGAGSVLMAALLDMADRWLGLLRVELTVYADNLPAQALYRKFGFEPEGRLRAYALRDGRYVDALAMARMHPDPPRWSP